MLQTMRSSAKIVFWFLAVAFIGGYLLVETSGLLGSSPVTNTTAVATVNGTDIRYTDWQRRAQQAVQNAQQQSGRSLTQDEVRRLENQAFDEMVADVLLEQEYKSRGIVVSDEELLEYAKFAPPQWVQSAPDLQTDGRFDPSKYQRLLTSSQARQSGLLVALEGYFRSEVPKQKLFAQVTSGTYVTDADLWRAWQDANDSASVSYVAFHPKPTAADSAASDSDLRTYYDAHKTEFDRPGRAVLSVLYIPRVITAADSAASRAHAEQLRAEIAGGTKFEDVAKRESGDTASAVQGGDLGKAPKDRYVAEFAKAAMGLKPGELSQPVLTQFGYHIIRLDSRSGDTLGLHHILVRVAASDSSAVKIDRTADQLSKLAAGSDQPAKFDEAAKSMGLTPFTVVANENEIAIHNGRDVPSVSAWAFGGVHAGESSDLFDSEDGYYLARLDSIVAGGKTFDAVRGSVRGRVADERAIERVGPSALALAKAAQTSSLEAAAAAAGMTVEKTGMVNRVGASRAFGALGEATGAAFVAPLNEVAAPIRERDAIFVIRTDARKPSDKDAFEKQKKDLRGMRANQLRQQRFQMFMEDLRNGATIKDRRKDINAQVRKQSAA